MMDPLEHLQMLKDSAAGIAPRKGDLKRIRALRFTEPGFDRDTWREMCEMGWLGLRIPENDGGSGLGAREFCGLAEELGAGLVPEPLIAAAMAAQLLPPDHLAPVLAGERIVLAAWQEKPNSIDLIGDTVLRDGRLSGRKVFIPMAAGADAFLVTVPGGLALVERDAPGVSLEIQQTQDGGNFGTLILDNAPAEAIEGDATEALEHTIMAQRRLSVRTDGSRLHDHARLHEDARAVRPQDRQLPGVAASRGRHADPGFADPRDDRYRGRMRWTARRRWRQRQAAVSRAKVRASDAAMVVTRTCIQLHGGIGYTDAYDIGLFLRKAMVLSPLYGSPSVHRRRFRTVAPEIDDE